MKIVFFGTPEPAAEILQLLVKQQHNIVGVVSQPDRPQGRGQKVLLTPVKKVAVANQLVLQQPEKVAAIKDWLRALQPDLAVVVAYGKIVPEDLLTIPRCGFINVHASLLPQYRGAAPIQWALLNGEKETGVTIFKLIKELDAGAIMAQEKAPILLDDDYESLAGKLFVLAAPLLMRVINDVKNGRANFVPQNEGQVTYAPRLTKESGEIDWRKTAAEIHNRVRALVTWPTAHTYCHGKQLKIFHTALDPGEKNLPGTVGQISREQGIAVATGAGNILIAEVQLAAGKRMSAYNFALGHDLKTGETLPN
jgi:methionyl-tRNA formyltransferase